MFISNPAVYFILISFVFDKNWNFLLKIKSVPGWLQITISITHPHTHFTRSIRTSFHIFSSGFSDIPECFIILDNGFCFFFSSPQLSSFLSSHRSLRTLSLFLSITFPLITSSLLFLTLPSTSPQLVSTLSLCNFSFNSPSTIVFRRVSPVRSDCWLVPLPLPFKENNSVFLFKWTPSK